jgi:hypothetical protein
VVSRVLGFLAILAALGASAYVFVGKARTGDLNPVTAMDDAATRGELASAQYVLGIVAGQLAQVKVLSGSYAGTLDYDRYPLVTLVRADERSYCLEFTKTHTFALAGPGGTVRAGRC